MNSSESKSHSAEEIVKALLEPFQPSEVKFKPAVVKGDRAMALAYVDARVVQDRLDEVLGIDGWQDSYKCLEDGSVVCRLRLKIGGQWVTKMDVGGPSEQPDSGDRMKAAFSDALKRAAVKFGVGRYLYRFPSQWLAYDPHKKQFTQQPKLPAFAVPNSQPKPEKPQTNPDSDIKQSIVVEVKQSLDLADSLGRIQEVLSTPEAKSQPEQTRKDLWAYALTVAYRKFGVRWEGGQWVPANGEVA